MGTIGFEGLSKAFAARRTRRGALKGAAAGVAAASLGVGGVHHAAAQEATPTGPSADHLGLPEGERTFTMFIQTARAGTWAPNPDEEGTYTLTLTGLPAQTVYFSDRPSRVVGTQSTSEFLNALGFIPDNPPNAALVTTAEDGEDDILVIELFNPVYTEGDDEAGATLVYDARILENYHETSLGRIALEQDDTSIPASFEGASLFIDDCADGYVWCYGSNGVNVVHFGCCYSFPICRQCGDLSNICSHVPGCEHGCQEDFRGNCFL